jgi:gas vesicle protein
MSEEKNSGSFITGFGMGLLTGAAAYFLFGTEQGKELRRKALSEWDSAQKTITEETGVEVPKKLKNILQEVVSYFAQSIKEIQDLQENADTMRKSAANKVKKTEAKAKPSGRFKGL